MKAYALALTVLVLLAAPAVADFTPCSAQMVSGGLCRVEANTLLHWDAPTDILVELREAICSQYGYRENVVCSQELVDALLCDVADLDTVIPNPVSKAQFADAWIRAALRNVVVRQRAIDDVAAAEANVDRDVDVE